MFDGKVPHWHHFSCFWQRAAAQSAADIAGFSDLRWEDQEKVKKAIESGGAAGGQLCHFLVKGLGKYHSIRCDDMLLDGDRQGFSYQKRSV